jgi:hypothetical protein
MGMEYDLVEKNIKNDNWTFNLEWLMLPSPSSDDGIESDSVETNSVIVKLIYAFSCVLIVVGAEWVTSKLKSLFWASKQAG